MATSNDDLHGSAPDTCPVALLIVDIINDFDFPEGEQLLQPALDAAHAIDALKARCSELGVPVIYANDNFGRWRSDFRELIDHVRTESIGKPIAELMHPGDDDYFALKPKHSAFYATTLDTLLQYLGTRHIVLTGLTTDMCVLFTANDAYMRDYVVHIPPDCVAAVATKDNPHMLEYMQRVLKADITMSKELDLEALAGEPAATTP